MPTPNTKPHPTVRKQRRRKNRSEWLLTLQQRRKAKVLRETLPHPQAIGPHQSYSESERQHLSTNGQDHFSLGFDDEVGTFLRDPALDEQVFLPLQPQTLLSPPQHPEHNFGVIDQPEPVRQPSLDCLTPPAQDSDDVNQNLSTNIPSESRRTSGACSSNCGTRHVMGRTTNAADLDLLNAVKDMWRNDSTLSAVFAIVGSVRYSARQYEYSRIKLRERAQVDEQTWPSYYRIKQTFKAIRDNCFPESTIIRLLKQRKQKATEQVTQSGAAYNARQIAQTEPLRVFFPTSWAKLDVATSAVFDQMFPDCHNQELDASDIVVKRNKITNPLSNIFVYRNGESVQCGPGSVIRIHVQGSKPRYRTQFQISESENHYHIEARIKAIWCVGNASEVSSTVESTLNSRGLTSQDRKIILNFRNGEVHQTEAEREGETENPKVVRPGDVCTLIAAQRQYEVDDYVPVLIHKYWRSQSGTPSVIIAWVCPSQLGNVASTDSVIPHRGSSISYNPDTQGVNHVSLISQHTENTEAMINTRGLLADGTPYLVYRILLYCDDFQKSSGPSKNSSVGGFYFMPLNFRPEQRRTTSSARLISLTPPGISTNDVMHFIVDDLVHGTVCGVQGYTPLGEEVQIFLDVIGFIGDYPASSGVIDVIGHTARSPCTLCSFRRLHQVEAEGTRFGYTTEVHANNSSFLRSAERHEILRESGISDVDAKTLGFSKISTTNIEDWPLHRLRAALNRHKERIPLTDKGNPVVSGLIDPYRSNFVAPDHLLTGLAKDALNTAFNCFPTKRMREQAEAFICASLRENGLLPQKEIYNANKRKLHSMTLSELYCVLLAAVPCLKVVTAQCPSDSDIRSAVKIVAALQRLTALTYWWPQHGIDGREAEEFVRCNKKGYFSELRRLSREYVQLVDAFCVKCEVARQHLDKPNLHRMLELYQHSIPAFGHVREFM